LTGQVSFAAEDARGQAIDIFNKIDKMLAQAGTDKSRLLTAMIWVKDMKTDFVPMNEEWNAWIDPDNKPTRACVESPLARESLRVEVQVTAAVGEDFNAPRAKL